MQVGRWGNSLAVRLPARIVEQLALREGDEVEIEVGSSGQLTLNRDPAREAALARLRAMARPAPPGFKFDRDEANER